MCGIAGHARAADSSTPPPEALVVQAMTRALHHRGPDDEGYVSGNGVALGHRRLVVIDRDGGIQPMRDEQRGLAVVFNGEIYNYRALNDELAGLGFAARTRSDTETVLNAYAAWGDECVQRFNGMFAFVVHDERRRRLFGARDRMGTKPLCYLCEHGMFAFASEPGALLQHPAARRELDPEALARYLVFEHVPAPMTIYKGMRKLPRAHRFAFDLDTGRFSVEPYWELPVPTPADHEHDELHWTGRIRGVLAAAVTRRLESDVPLGAFLSGGIDSAAVTALIARRLGARSVQTFSLGFSDPRFDESGAARRLARAIGTDHHEQIVTPRDVVDALPEVDAILDEPFADASIIPTWMLCRFARRAVTVALSGDGGDELFAGYQTFRALPAARLYNRLVPAALHRLVVMPMADRLPANNGYFSWDFKVRQFLRGMKVPPHERLWRWLGAMAPEELSGLLMPDVLREIEPRALFAQLRWLDGSMVDRDPVVLDTHMFTRTYLAEGVLAKVDRASMACSLEVRSPLLDVELVELAASIPGRFKVKRGAGLKHVFRQAVRDLVPAEVLQRPKRGFALPIGAWFRGELREMLLDTLDDRTIREQGLFRPEAVRRLLDEHLSGRRDHRKPLFALFMFERWRQQWLERVETPATRIAA